MSTYIKKTNAEGKFVTDQQATMLHTYNNNIYTLGTNELKKIENFIVDRKTGEHKQWGGAVYLNAGDDLNTIVNQNIGIGRSWAFYYGKQTNNKGDVLWESVVYIKGELKYKRIKVLDNKERVIASCEIDLLTGQKTNKRKCFYGDPSLFFYSFGDETNPNIKFWYNEDDTIEEVFYYDDDYTLDEFLANDKIMAQFLWDQHNYFHSFEPMLPDGNTNVSPQYQRNYEENVGVSKYESTTNKLYEDYFVENRSVGIKKVVDNFISSLNTISKDDTSAYTKIKSLVETSAKSLWDTSVSFVKSTMPDDRPLYWARIKMQVALKKHPYFLGQFTGSEINSGSNLEKVLQIFEEKSRNYTGIDFSKAPTGAKKILITGFDPFQLNDNIKQSNPSGCVALNLFDTLTENKLGYIQSMIVPVRYKDFDSSSNSTSGQGEGIIEKYIKAWINKVDMIITISQALPDQYHIDVFATATRGGFEDNLNYTRIKNSKSVSDTSPETIVTTLPENFTVNPSQAIFYGKYFENEGEYFNYGRDLDNSPHNALKSNFPSSKIYYGPGGNYLSNEIFYRVAKMRSEMKPTLATGHFHVAKLQNDTENFDIDKTNQLIDTVKNSINSGIK